jgi:deoxyribodipyrimidine photo-lyase
MSTALVWLRRDLRLSDNPALDAALAAGHAIVPVFVWDPEEDPTWPPGGATRWYLQASLRRLEAALAALGSRLIFARGAAREVLPRLALACDARAVYCSRRYEPAALRADAVAEAALRAADIALHALPGSLLCEPWTLTRKAGGPYQVFTPYWREFLASVRVAAAPVSPRTLVEPARWPGGEPLESLAIAPHAAWHASLATHWQPGEVAATQALEAFVTEPLDDYAGLRDRVDLPATSRLSPRLHHGELSPRQVWTAIGRRARRQGTADETWRAGKFCAELIWREFAAHALYHFPELPDRSFQSRYEQLAWRDAPADLEAWQRGRTGVALVDAGMRELWTTGFMHNRARMVCASFLTKNLLIHWREGARWFWDTLVDADLGNNSLNWQWVAGTGPDAAPWFRIFNPDTQADKFDPQGDYRRRWLGSDGRSGAPPLADLAASRQRALAAQREI